MPAKLAILRSAKQDLNKGFHWYEGQRARGLGTLLSGRAASTLAPDGHCTVSESLDESCRIPIAGAAVRGFHPYIVIYYYDEPNDTVIDSRRLPHL